MIESCVCSFSDITHLHLMRIRFLHFCARGATFPRALMQHFPVHGLDVWCNFCPCMHIMLILCVCVFVDMMLLTCSCAQCCLFDVHDDSHVVTCVLLQIHIHL